MRKWKQYESGVDGGDSIVALFRAIGPLLQNRSVLSKGGSSAVVDALFPQVGATEALISAFGDPHAEMTRGQALRRGLAGLGGGLALLACAVALIALGVRGGGFVLLMFFLGIVALGYGTWFLQRALGSGRAPTLEGSECWECAMKIRFASDGLICAQCTHPVHARCQAKHERTLHAA